MSSVGSSPGRTPFKHDFLDAFLGMNIGAASRIPWITDNLLLDCNAGHGIIDCWSMKSSPAIFLRHLPYAEIKPTRCCFIERDPYNVDRLRDLIKGTSAVVIPGDYRSEQVALRIGPSGPKTNAFVHIDPNHANDVELSEHLRAILPRYTLLLCNLGCNASGIKRLPFKERILWFDRLKHIIGIRIRGHDVCLIILNRDSDQWAYVATTPRAWRDRIHKIAMAYGKRHWDKGIVVYWISDGEKVFWEAAERLFLKIDGSEKQYVQTSFY